MKAGIVTLFSENYGNRLQNYALQVMIQDLGYEATTILVKDGERLHRPESKNDVTSKLLPKHLKQVISSRFKNRYPFKNDRDGIIKSVMLGKTDKPDSLRMERSNRFKRFNEKYINTDINIVVDGINTFHDEYSVYVCGSDQIWNPNYSSTSSAYFLQFAPENKRIAFAPSFGLSELPEIVKPLYSKWLNEIPFLSVREEIGASIIKSLTGRIVPVLPDPTLCLSANEWEKIEKNPGSVKKKYVLTYFLGNEKNNYRRIIAKYAAKKHCQIIDLLDMLAPEYYSIDPAEFVWLIHHANAVFTDSFHGTVFSLIFHTPFVVFERVESGGNAMSSRIDTLLKMAGMEDRTFESITLDRIDDITFNAVDLAIEKQVANAKQFLKQSLDSIVISEHNDIKCVQDSMICDEKFIHHSSIVGILKYSCNGCTACVNICPVQCIKMKEDKEGFLYPSIDQSKCIGCNNCLIVCRTSEDELGEGIEKAYVAYTKDKKVRRESSSGGIFSLFAEKIIERNGVVYGAGFDSNYEVRHVAVHNKEELDNLRGSKYVQSRIGNCFKSIKSSLEEGKLVYFSGTPCQVDGLIAYLGKDYDNLYTQDIICHGVPSPSVWKANLQMITNGDEIKSVSFRDKTYGWRYFSTKIETKNKKYVKRLDEDTYTRLFLNNITLRPSCYSCHHKHLHRKSDLTLADCWGTVQGMADDDCGISLFFANTYKAQLLTNEIKEKMIIREISYEEAALKQEAMFKSAPYNQNRELFYSTAESIGMKETLEKWYGWESISILKKKVGFYKYKVYKLIHRYCTR